jgi:hypothetical protein
MYILDHISKSLGTFSVLKIPVLQFFDTDAGGDLFDPLIRDIPDPQHRLR